jgi:hypothetical protein
MEAGQSINDIVGLAKILIEHAYGLDVGYYLANQFQCFCGGANVKIPQTWKPWLIEVLQEDRHGVLRDL